MLDWSPFVELVGRHQRFLLTTHVRPDGDALGSVLAVAEALEALGKSVIRLIPSPLPTRYDFMDPNRSVEVYSGPNDRLLGCDALIVLDTGTWNQLAGVAEVVRKATAEIAVVDHHATQDDLGGTAFVDTSAEACGRLACEVIDALGVPLTATMAQNLFVALAMDTGWFRHASTRPQTLALAERLVASGAMPTPIYDELFEKNSLPKLLLTGRVLGRMKSRADGRVVYSEVYLPDYAETGAVPLDTEDLVNYPRSVEGCEVGLLFMEQREGSVKVSFRSRRANVAKLAEKFGGGGHKLASGATVSGTISTVREQVVAAAIGALDNPASGAA